MRRCRIFSSHVQMVIWMPLSFVPTLRRGLRDINLLSIIRGFRDRTGLSVTSGVPLRIPLASYRFVYRQFSDHFQVCHDVKFEDFHLSTPPLRDYCLYKNRFFLRKGLKKREENLIKV